MKVASSAGLTLQATADTLPFSVKFQDRGCDALECVLFRIDTDIQRSSKKKKQKKNAYTAVTADTTKPVVMVTT